jgi:hypothetical protein
MVSFCCNVLSRLLDVIKIHKNFKLDHKFFVFIATYLAIGSSRLFQYYLEFFGVVFIRTKEEISCQSHAFHIASRTTM